AFAASYRSPPPAGQDDATIHGIRRLRPDGARRTRAFHRRDPAALPRSGETGIGADLEPAAARSTAGSEASLRDVEKALRARARRASAPRGDATFRAGAVEVGR